MHHLFRFVRFLLYSSHPFDPGVSAHFLITSQGDKPYQTSLASYSSENCSVWLFFIQFNKECCHRRSRSYLSDSTSALSSTRRFSRWSKRIFEPEKHLSNGLNGLPEKEENHGASRSSQQDLNGTKESILIVSAL